MRLLADDLVVLAVCADPYPHDSVFDINAKCTMMDAGTHRPVVSDALEVQGGMARIRAQQFVVLIRHFAHVTR